MRIKEILAQDRCDSGKLIEVCGWVRTVRHSKDVSFVELHDGSCFSGLQIVIDAQNTQARQQAEKLRTGFSLRTRGVAVPSPAKGQKIELRGESIEIIGEAPEDYPLQKKHHSFEFLRDIAHLRPRTNTFGAILRVRNAAARAIHHFFQQRGFLWVHTPIITAADCEGAGAMFRVTTLPAANPPLDAKGQVDFSGDFFARETHLTVSGQLEGETAACALGNIYTFGPTFRAENSNTSRHLAEFWMVEPEMAFCDLQGDMDLAEAFIKSVFADVLRDCPDDMEFFNQRIDPTVLSILQSIIASPFVRMTYSEAVQRLLDSGKKFEFPVSWGMDLQSEHERFLTEELLKCPVIVTDYPKSIKAFYMYLNDDGKTVRAMDVLVPKIGEVIGGAQREHRADCLLERIREMGLSEDNYRWYLDLRRYGTVPHAGFGLGFERLIQFMTGMANIRDCIAFPRVPGWAEF